MVVCVVMACGCQRSRQKQDTQRGGSAKNPKAMFKQEQRPKPVHAVVIQNGAITSMLSSTTTLVSEENVAIFTQVSGVVDKLYGWEGRYFKRGATLAVLDNPYLKIAHEAALLQVKKLENDLAREKRLQIKGYVSRETIENLSFQLAQARNSLQRAEQDLYNLQIKATISGIITQRDIQRGAWVTPQLKAFSIENPQTLTAQLAVPERYLPNLRTGLVVNLQAEALGNKGQLKGQVLRISPAIDPKTGTINVVVGKLDPSRSLRSGMFVTAQIVLERREQIPLIPKVAVQYQENKAFVFRLRANTDKCRAKTKSAMCATERVFFQKGLEDENWIEALSSVKSDDMIIILGQQGLRDGNKVRVVYWQEQQVNKSS
jgi:membrane fusion protein (multidrug efflux system)